MVIIRLRAVGVVFLLPGSRGAPPPPGVRPSWGPPAGGPLSPDGEGQILYKGTRHQPRVCFFSVGCMLCIKGVSFCWRFWGTASFYSLSFIETFVESFAGICALLRAEFSWLYPASLWRWISCEIFWTSVLTELLWFRSAGIVMMFRCDGNGACMVNGWKYGWRI